LKKKEREAIFALLKKHGITRVVLFFDGGHDEGAVNDYVFYKGTKPVTLLDDGTLVTALIDKESTPGIIARMEEILYDYYGGFDSHPEVWGDIVWNVAKQTITLKAEEEVTTTKKYKDRL
jgi:hypothetical protein